MEIFLQEIDQLPPSVAQEMTSEFEDWGVSDAELTRPVDLRRWAIVNDNGEVVGVLSCHPVSYGPNPQSIAMNIGISVLPKHRGMGVGSQAQLMLAQVLHAEGKVRVEASTDTTNIAEQRALANAGFKYEGTLRSAQVRASGRHDLQVWSHLG